MISCLRMLLFPLVSLSLWIGQSTAASADENPPTPAHWIYLGTEREDIVDEETGRTIRYLTSGHELESIQHYHNGTFGFINGVHYVFVESARARPPEAAGLASPGEKQLLAINVETGAIYYLTTIPNPSGGEVSQWSFRQYHSAFFAPWNVFVYFDKDFRVLRAYDALTGTTTHLFSLPAENNARARQFSLGLTSDDRMRVLYGYSVNPLGDNRTKDSVYYADFNRDYTLHERQLVRESKLDEAYNHMELRPGDPDWMFVIHHYGKATKKTHSPYSHHITQILNLKSPDVPRVVVNPDNITCDHQIWGHSGRAMYWDDNRGNMMRIDFETLERTLVGRSGSIHNHLSPDEKLWVYDLRGKAAYESWQADNGRTVGNWRGTIWVYDVQSRQHAKYANIVWGDPHPRHPHAQFSHDGKLIAFVTGVDGGMTSRIAVMDVAPAP